MNDKTREIVEIVGIFSVVASLLFVGLQLILDRRVATGAQFHERMALGHDSFEMQFQNDEWIRTTAKQWEAGNTPGWWNEDVAAYREERNLSMEELVRESIFIQMTYLRMNNNYFQYQQGLIPDETWARLEPGIRTIPRSRPLYKAIAENFVVLEQGYIELMDLDSVGNE